MLTILSKPDQDRIVFTIPNGSDDPAHAVQHYQLAGAKRRLDFACAVSPRDKLAAIGHGISGATMDGFSDEEVARLNAAYVELVGAPAQ